MQPAETGSEKLMSGTERLVVVTGGPGAGKTTLIEELSRRGVATAPEAGRAVIRAQRASGGTGLPWADRALFAELMAFHDIASHKAALASQGIVVFDRAIPDVIGYLRLCDLPVPAALDAAAHRLRYRARVFAAPPWRTIYENDADRRQDFDEACRACEAATGAFRDYGYDLCPLPLVGVAERADFLLAHIGGEPHSVAAKG